METILAMSKLAGSFFYYPLTHENNTQCINVIKQSEDLDETGFSAFLTAYEKSTKEEIASEFQRLFEGSDIMPAPPWGSVYLDREQVIFGDSTLRFRQFLAENQIELNTGMREPEDQFGLSLLAMAMIIEQNKGEAVVIELLSQHLLPWAYRYLTLVQKHSETGVYASLAAVTEAWLKELEQAFSLQVHDYKLYF